MKSKYSPFASIKEAEKFLKLNPAVKSFDILMHDANTVGRGKIIRRHELLSLYKSGRKLPLSTLGMDITGEDVPDTGLVLNEGDMDIFAHPIPNSLILVHKSNPPRGEVMMSMRDKFKKPILTDPRNILENKILELQGKGISAKGAFELEFFLVSHEPDQYGKLQPAKSIVGKKKGSRLRTDVYSVDHLHGMMPLFDDVYEAAHLAGIQAETVISEYAPGQFELTLNYQDSLLKAADDILRLKRIIRTQARSYGVTACFMPKPIENVSGSGMHFHISLFDKKGKNMFAESKKDKFNPNLLHAIGGLRNTMADSMLVFAPNANSWRRFLVGSYAPITPNWGFDNRSVAFRIPSSGIKSRRIEHRVSGVDANPYLVALTVLSAIEFGLKEKLDPGAQTFGNAYEQKFEKIKNMPDDWNSAIKAAKKSSFLKDTFGADFHKAFIAIKKMEYRKVMETVSELDLELYLNAI